MGAFLYENQYGWMNAMKGNQWKDTIRSAKKEFGEYLEKNSLNSLASLFDQELQSQPSYTSPTQLDSIQYEMAGSQTIVWNYKKQFYTAADIDIDGENVWAVEDKSNGSEQYTLSLYSKGKIQWTLKKNVGPFVAVVGNRCYCIELKNYLWHYKVISVDALTGKDEQVLLEMTDPQWNLQFLKGRNKSLFFMANNAGEQRCWFLQETAVKEITGFQAFVPVEINSSNQPCYFARKQGSTVYKAVNCQGKFPSFERNVPEFYDSQLEILITRYLGKRTVWKKGKPIETILGNIDIDPLPSWKNKEPSITVAKPGSYRQNIGDDTLCSYAKSQYKMTKSKDNTSVPYILVSSCKPKYLLCIVYGAYGVPTRLTTDRWKPLLDRGWALCFALVRGGGDHTDEWAEAARREKKIKSIEDYEACILAARKSFHLPAEKTFLYGRSAGGYTVGATLSRHTSGSLFQGVYTEVPYVDVLSTTGNPDLPLTKLEYDEFGNPRRLQNAFALLQLSPIHSLPPSGAPDLFVLSRTALNDKEVFAYESVKWITTLKDLQKEKPNAKVKLLAIEEGEGHFAPSSSASSQRSKDMAILHFWATENKKSHDGIYKMATRRNNVAARKRRNNVSMRKRRNNVTMGGKRKRSGARKGKGTRRH